MRPGRFRHFLAIDWSGAAGERQKGIALAIADADGGPPVLIDPPLRGWSREDVLAILRDAVAGAMARFGGWLPGAPMTQDQWLMLQRDNVVSPGAEGFEAFGIEPAPLAAVAPTWLVRYRRQGRFSLNATA